MPTYALCPPFWARTAAPLLAPAVLGPHRRPDPLRPGQLRRGHLHHGELVTSERVGRPRVAGDRPGRPDHLLGGDRHPPVRDRRPVPPQPPVSPVETI